MKNKSITLPYGNGVLTLTPSTHLKAVCYHQKQGHFREFCIEEYNFPMDSAVFDIEAFKKENGISKICEVYYTTDGQMVVCDGVWEFNTDRSICQKSDITDLHEIQNHSFVKGKYYEPNLIWQVSFNTDFEPLPQNLLLHKWEVNHTGRSDLFPETNFPNAYHKTSKFSQVYEAQQLLKNKGFDKNVVKICVVDDALDTAHFDFDGRIKGTFNSDYNNENVSAQLDDWHGTSVTGIMASDKFGIVPNADIYFIKQRFISDTQFENWVDWVIERGIKIVNCSWGVASASFVLSTRMKAAIDRLTESALVFFAAGNDNRETSGFAAHKDVISVAATTSLELKADYSNYGKIDIAAPSNGSGGIPIYTSDYSDKPEGKLGYQTGYYTPYFGGTSAASPHAAAIGAMLFQVKSDLKIEEAKQAIFETSDAILPTQYIGKGRINALKSIEKILPKPSTISTTKSFDVSYDSNTVALNTGDSLLLDGRKDSGDYNLFFFKKEGDFSLHIYYYLEDEKITLPPQFYGKSTINLPISTHYYFEIKCNEAGQYFLMVDRV